jgi:branched-chain amino acid transport system ATP-binding protein
MLAVENLDLYYGDAQALEGVALEVPAGAIVAIVGANGAGKSSLIRTIAGIERARAGRVIFKGGAGVAMERVYAMFPKLAERRGQVAGTLSGGEQQMLAIGRCLMGRPELIMFDEPSLGLAPTVVQEVLHAIRALNADGLTVLLVEQNVAVSLKLSQHAYVLENGRVVMSGSGEALLRDDRVRQAYLGL